MCSPGIRVLSGTVGAGGNDNVVAALLCEMVCSFGNKLSLNSIADFVANKESVIRYMLAQKEYNRFLAIVDKRKECSNGEKESV